MKKRTRRTKGLFTWRQLTGALIGCGIALLGMLLLSLLLYWDKAGEGAIGPLNSVLKVVCPFAAGFIALRKTSERASVTGAVAGAYYGVPDDIREKAETFLDVYLLQRLYYFERMFALGS